MSQNSQVNYPNVAQSFGILGILIGVMILAAPITMITFISKEASTLLYYIVAMGVPLWIVQTIRQKKTNVINYNVTVENARIIPLIIIGAITLMFGVIEPISSLIPMPDFFKDMFMEMMGQTGVLSFVLIVIAAPVLEELLFRGIILDGLLKKYSPSKAIFISSFIFGLAHLNPWQFVTAMVLGVFMGWVYYKTKSVLVTMIIHFAANFSGFMIRYFVDFDTVDIMDMTGADLYGGAFNYGLVIVGCVLTALVCIYGLKKEFEKEEPKVVLD